MIVLWGYLFAWMPPALAILCLIYLAVLVVFIVIRIIALVLSAIPFL